MENQIFELQYAIDTFYFLVMGALVMWMAAGFSMLEAGLVRAKNTVEILTKNVALYAVSCIMYMVTGYAIMYGGEYLLANLALDGAESADALTATVLAASKEAGFGGDSVYSDASDFFFQVVFVATAMSIVSGAVAERMKLWAFLLFAVIMTGFIYPMEGSWTWGGNPVFGLYNLGDLGFSDFAGSGIVHMAGASAALAGVLLLGARKGKYGPNGEIRPIPGANLPLATLGTFILWFGWFGFNGGSVLKLGDVANANSVAMVFVNTNAAAAGGVVAALIVHRRAFHAHGAAGHPVRCCRWRAGGVQHPDTGQTAHRRSRGRHLGTRRGGLSGPDAGSRHQQRFHLHGAADRCRHHLRLGVRCEPGGLVDHQGDHGPARLRGRGVRRRGSGRMRDGSLSRVHRRQGLRPLTDQEKHCLSKGAFGRLFRLGRYFPLSDRPAVLSARIVGGQECLRQSRYALQVIDSHLLSGQVAQKFQPFVPLQGFA